MSLNHYIGAEAGRPAGRSCPHAESKCSELKEKYKFSSLLTGGLIHYYLLDESFCHFRGVGSILSLILFLIENPVSKQCRP